MNDWERVPPERDLPPARHAQRREHLMAEITPKERRRRLSRKARWITGITVGAVIAGGGIATATTQFWDGGGAADTTNVECHDRADLNTSDITILRVGGRTPVDACAKEWRKGHVKKGVHAAPPLVSCLLKTGPVGVFPGAAGTCERMGLAPTRTASPAERARFEAVRRLDTDLHERLARCVSQPDAERYVRERLTALRLPGWNVTVTGYDARNRCTSYGLEPEHDTVRLVGIERP
ncbi:hypothetical protein [Actinoallomurus sp. NPDC050550]|uniref:hypothetical protein n=1 Tax=Actinoallomurus sp. NPDC050550 TaxID=3154937 RepID=UPI0033CC2A65